MRFNPSRFDRHLQNIGQRVLWRHSYACACVNAASGQPDPKHALCMGKGRLWDPAVATIAGVASQAVQVQWIQSGQFENGDLVVSVPQTSAMYNAGQFDRVVMKNSTDVFSMPLTRGAPSERILFPIQSINRVFWLHPTTRLIVEGGIPDFDADGHLTWTEGGEPPSGMVYSVTGIKFDEYFIFQGLLSDRGEHQGARLPKKVTLRKWDLFGR